MVVSYEEGKVCHVERNAECGCVPWKGYSDSILDTGVIFMLGGGLCIVNVTSLFAK